MLNSEYFTIPNNHITLMMLMNNPAKVPISVIICGLFILTVNINRILPEPLYVSNYTFGETNSCKCVIFRLDDIKNEYLDRVQLKIMNLFLSKGDHLSLGIIMNSTVKDSLLINKISEGNRKGLFELALHGWEHINYTTLSQLEQKNSLYKANEKMQLLFGKRSDIFIPPYNRFNNATLNAINELGIKIISSSVDEENKFNGGKSIFTSDAKNQNQSQNGSISQQVYHLPDTTDFKTYVGTSQFKVPIEQLAKGIDAMIDRFGYAIVLIHSDSFIKRDKWGNWNGDKTKAQIDENEMKKLENLIDLIKKKGIIISSFKKILDTTR
jgi:peptidoglycan/xylan/chitin deacetylase (PgdA/CDA1 family)